MRSSFHRLRDIFSPTSSLLLLLAACNAPAPATATEPTKAAVTDPAKADPTKADPAKAAEAEQHLKTALELEAAGRFPEARSAVDLAIAAGAGRDAKLLAAKLAILRDDLDAAVRLLEPLASDGGDALVLYNLGLIAQRRGEYNGARTRYLAAIKADPNYAPARYNLAILTFDAGVKDEAVHHAQKFLEMAPGDPLAPDLRRRVLGDPAPEKPAIDPVPPPADGKAATPTAGAVDPKAPAGKTGKDGAIDPRSPLDKP